jgi:hypothetical protein
VSTCGQLVQRVRELADGSPYVVEDTAEGFDVRLDLADARWHSLMSRESLRRVFVHHVAVDEEHGSLSITDDSRTVTWKAGLDSRDGKLVPSLSGEAVRFQGRVVQVSRQKVLAWDEKGTYGTVVDYRLDSREGHALIRTAARELGFEQRRGTSERIGLVVGVIGGVGAVLVVVVLLVAWLSGVRFS